MPQMFVVKTDTDEFGPLTAARLRQLAEKGEICPSDRVRKSDQQRWFLASAVKGLFPEEATLDLEDGPDEHREQAIIHNEPAGRPVAVVRHEWTRPEQSPPPPPTVKVNVRRQGNSLGVVSLVLGTIAFLICWIPLVGALGIPLSALGLLLGVLGFLIACGRRGASIGYPIGGTAISAVALWVAWSMTSAVFGGLSSFSSGLASQLQEQDETNQTVVDQPAGDATVVQSEDSPSDEPTVVGPPVAKSESAVSWAPARYAVEQGDIRVKVTEVHLGQISLRDTYSSSNRSTSRDEHLSIVLDIANISTTRKIDYRTWAGQSFSLGLARDTGGLSDEYGNKYKRITFGFGTEPSGRTENGSIRPGESITDVLVFERPIDAATKLRLELPGTNFGGEAMLRIEIPEGMVEGWKANAVDDSQDQETSQILEVPEVATSFFGLEAHGTRIAYVVDVSGSMGVNGKIDRLRSELVRSLDGMLETASFFVCLYNSSASPIGGKADWVSASDSGKRWANRHIANIVAAGGTAPLPGFEMVFSRRARPDAVYFMTDGQFDPEVAMRLRFMNAEARIPIHCITFDDRGAEAVMRQIARDSGGTYTHVPGPGG